MGYDLSYKVNVQKYQKKIKIGLIDYTGIPNGWFSPAN
jgi:hypothetical protein